VVRVFPGSDSGSSTGETAIHHVEGVHRSRGGCASGESRIALGGFRTYAAAIGKEGLERETLIEVEQKLSLGIPARDAGLHPDARFWDC